MRLSRRGFFTGAGAAAVVGSAAGVGIYERVLPGRPQLQAALGLNGADGVVPDIEPGPVTRGSFMSAARGGVETEWVLIRPPGVTGPLPMVVAMHALGWQADSLLEPTIGVPQFLAAAVADGVPPFAILTADGGRSYWHPRPDGEDASAMITEELLPMFSNGRAAPAPIGLLGWSMGGYGALRLAAELGPDRVAAVSAVSPAIWSNAEDARASGFASPEEYEKYTVTGRQSELDGIPVRIDIGTGDPLFSGVEDYVDGFSEDADLTHTYEPGGHDAGYWRRMLPKELKFLGERLAG